jgi:hypothetical protein
MVIELMHAVLSLWLIGLALAVVLGRAGSYVRRAQRTLLAPMKWLASRLVFGVSRLARSVTRSILEGICRW